MYLVECLKVADRGGLLGVVGKLVLEVSNEHAKLCPPVTNMIEPREGRGGEGRGGEGRGGEGRGGEGREREGRLTNNYG